ncbi:MAG: hypothetical protein ACRD3W_04290, partial [Terriglobales bacterium]
GNDDCINQLTTNSYGLGGYCLSSIQSMEATYNHQVPTTTPAADQQNFSQADWAKAMVLTAFENPSGAIGGTNSLDVNLTATSISGLGVFDWAKGASGPATAQNYAVPIQGTMPVEKVGSIKDLMNMVMDPSCYNNLKAQIVQRCQQIQPMTGAGDVDGFLNTAFPMAPTGSANPNKLFIYLPGGDPSAALVCDAGPPKDYAGGLPDGTASSGACSKNKLYIDDTIVNSQWDQNVHDRPYTIETPDPASGLYVLDNAQWTPGSGANNCMGLVDFREAGIGDVQFQHIN